MGLFIACKYTEHYLHVKDTKTPFAKYFTCCCQLLHFSSLKKKKKISYINQRANIQPDRNSFWLHQEKKKVCDCSVSVWILSLESPTAVHTKAFVGDVKLFFSTIFSFQLEELMMVSQLQALFLSIPPNQVALVALAGLGPGGFRLCLWAETRDQGGKKMKKPTQKNQPEKKKKPF